MRRVTIDLHTLLEIFTQVTEGGILIVLRKKSKVFFKFFELSFISSQFCVLVRFLIITLVLIMISGLLVFAKHNIGVKRRILGGVASVNNSKSTKSTDAPLKPSQIKQ